LNATAARLWIIICAAPVVARHSGALVATSARCDGIN
jgi:hypothetical protein